MKIPLLLREIETRTTGRQEKETVLKILEKEEASIRELDDKMKWLKNFERLLEIQRSLVWPSVLDLEPKIVVPDFLKAPLAKQPCERLIVSPRRQIVLEGPLNLLDSGRPSDMHVILFDDMLLITRKKKGLGKKVGILEKISEIVKSAKNPTDFVFFFTTLTIFVISLGLFDLNLIFSVGGSINIMKIIQLIPQFLNDRSHRWVRTGPRVVVAAAWRRKWASGATSCTSSRSRSTGSSCTRLIPRKRLRPNSTTDSSSFASIDFSR